MAGNKNSGFGSFSPAQRKYVSQRGGSKQVPKGLALLPEERRKEIARRGGLKRSENIKKQLRERTKNGEDSIPSGDTSNPA